MTDVPMTDAPMTEPAPMAGHLDGKTFVLPVRVYYEDTDAGGVVYYANYLKYAERARTEMLRHLGIENSHMQSCHGLAFVVRHIEADYRRPAHLDDALDVSLELTRVGGASLEGTQVIACKGQDLVRLNIRLGCMDIQTGGPGRLPGDIRERLAQYVQDVQSD